MGVINVWWLVMYLCSGSICSVDPSLPPRLDYVKAWCEQDVQRRMSLYEQFGVADAHRGACIPDALALPKAPPPYTFPDTDLATRAVDATGNIRLGMPAPR